MAVYLKPGIYIKEVDLSVNCKYDLLDKQISDYEFFKKTYSALYAKWAKTLEGPLESFNLTKKRDLTSYKVCCDKEQTPPKRKLLF